MGRRAPLLVGPIAAVGCVTLALVGCGESPPSQRAKRPIARPSKTFLPQSRRYYNPNYRLHRPFHRYRYAGYTYNDEIGEDIVGARTPYSRVIAVFGAPRRVPAVDRRDRQGHPCIYYGVISPHGEVSTSEWQFCFKRGRMYGAFDGEPRDHRPSGG
jgi:hypothetical protein